MRTTFRTTFDLSRPDTAATAVFEEAARRCFDWATARGTREGREALRPAQLLESIAATQIGNNAVVEVAADHDSDQHLWALRVTHPDFADPAVHWHAELGLRLLGNRVVFSCWLHYVLRDGVLRKVARDASRPRIVADLVAAFSAHAGHRLLGRPEQLGEGDVPALVMALQDPARRRPIVLVSCRNLTDRPAIDPVTLAERLAGLAHVSAATSRFPSFLLRDRLPPRLCAWDGAVRLYWPGFRLDDDPREHPVWPRETIRTIEDERGLSFSDVLFFRLCALAAMTADPEAVDFASVDAVRRRKLIADLRERGAMATLVDEVDKENLSLREQLAGLNEQVHDLRQQLERAKGEADGWRQAYEEEARTPSLDKTPESSDATILTVADAVAEAQKRFSGQLAFSPNSRSMVKDSLFEKPGELFEVFEFLATTYYEARVGKAQCADFNHALRERCGWSYEGHQSERTMTTYRDWYRTRFDGREVWLPEHAGTGASKDPRVTFRLGFAWDRDSGKVVIGFLGQHQETAKT